MEGPIPEPETLDDEGDDDIVRTHFVSFACEVSWLTASVASKRGPRKGQIRAFSIAAETVLI